MRLACLRTPAEHGGVVHDHAAARRLHHPQRRSSAAKRPRQRHIDDLCPVVVSHVDERDGATQPGVVHEDVDRSELMEGGGEEPPDAFLDRDIAHRRGRTELRRRLSEPSCVGVTQHHARTLLDTPFCGRIPDAGAGRRCDDNRLALEKTVGSRGLRHRAPPGR